MSIFHRVMDRLAHRLWADRKVTLRFTADYRIAGFTLPLIERLLLDNDDGETYRSSIADWTLNERPSLHIYRGEVSSLRIDISLEEERGHTAPCGCHGRFPCEGFKASSLWVPLSPPAC